jgi:hypothetical protein
MFKLKCLIKNFKLKNISSLVVEYLLLQDTKDKKKSPFLWWGKYILHTKENKKDHFLLVGKKIM